MKTFFNLYHHGFIRVAVGVPEVKVADVDFNTEKTIELAHRAVEEKAMLAVFPELGLSAYSNEDLFHQEALLSRVRLGIEKICDWSRDKPIILIVGAPLADGGRLFNCAVVIGQGSVWGVAVKSYLPNYREFYEARQFRSAREAISPVIKLAGRKDVPCGADLIFQVEGMPPFNFYVELCEDLWVPIPPSSYASLAGATVIANLSASNVTVGKADYRRELVANQSARCVAAYLYTAAGSGESTTDLAWDGQALVYENGTCLAESERFAFKSQIIFADIDLDRLIQDRMRMNTFSLNALDLRDRIRTFRFIPVGMDMEGPKSSHYLPLSREIPRFPYVPADPALRDQRCYEVYNIQVAGLAKRIESSGVENVIIGISGGLDSTHALLVAARTMDVLGRKRSCIKAFTMPGFATSEKTYRNAWRLMEALEVEAKELDIRPSSMQMLKDIGHPYAEGEAIYDVTFENVQAGERTSHLFRLANLKNGIVLGTGDLSELALGWCTYGVGDHMSHYAINASVPKTLIQHLIRWVADRNIFSPEVSPILRDILATEISPELVPGEGKDEPAQRTEEIIGPYELHDFFNYYITRYGYRPAKVAFLAWMAWKDKDKGLWIDVPSERRKGYSIREIKHWLSVYLYRFFKLSQFKRSCIPNGPKVGSGGSLSPRGDYRAPSDSEARVWLDDLSHIPDHEEA
ncbi:MAG TPA: NAD(+) synthase [Syntrophales bacterium]|nr:NAD(+) synthase [Syntrophales bacterium]HOL58624.1 NAD(+) synthase [Syntrophales bacterium]HPO35088.1 NAD(+) synthase [Syntrophales bacterium]